MNSQKHPNEDHQQREKELQERERALRLRELEAELSQPALLPTTKHQETRSLQRWTKKARTIVTFVGIVLVTVVAVRIAAQLAGVVMVLGIAWIAYKLFFERDTPKK